MLGYINDEDLRSKELAKIFKDQNYEITTLVSRAKEADFLYLGLRGTGFEKQILKAGSRVYTLVYNKNIETLCKESEVMYYYLYSDEDLIIGNTYLTTEALLAYMVIDNNRSILNSQVLVIGYGHCGKDIANKLQALQAKVSIANRGYHHEHNVRQQGYPYFSMEQLDLSKYDFIINTVPSPILTKEILSTKKDSSKIYDIASFPYGVGKNDRCLNYYILSSLPSKYAYVSAAQLIYQAITKKEDEYGY